MTGWWRRCHLWSSRRRKAGQDPALPATQQHELKGPAELRHTSMHMLVRQPLNAACSLPVLPWPHMPVPHGSWLGATRHRPPSEPTPMSLAPPARGSTGSVSHNVVGVVPCGLHSTVLFGACGNAAMTVVVQISPAITRFSAAATAGRGGGPVSERRLHATSLTQSGLGRPGARLVDGR